MNPRDKKIAIRDYLYENVNVALSSVVPPLLEIEEFLMLSNSDHENRVCYVFNPMGSRLGTRNDDFFSVRFQLPGEKDPDKYNDVILEIIDSMDPSIIGVNYIDVHYGNTYPYQYDNGQTGYCEYVLECKKDIDDCEGE